MKKLLLALGFAAISLSASAENYVYFQDDFEWIEPWCIKNEALDWIPVSSKEGHQAIKTTNTDENGVALMDALLERGYRFIVVNHETKPSRADGNDICMQKNYLKFGTTGYNAGIILPALTELSDNTPNLTLEFDWVPMRQGSPLNDQSTRVFDATQLLIEIITGEDYSTIEVPNHNLQKGEDPRWIHASIDLSNKGVTSRSKITIRQIDSQWPVDAGTKLGTKSVCRYFLDNLKVSGDKQDGITDLNSDNASAEYFNLQGMPVANPENGIFICRQGNKVTKVVK